MKELRISTVIQLPDGLFGQAKAIAAVQPLIKAFEEHLNAGLENPSPSIVVEAKQVTSRETKEKPKVAEFESHGKPRAA